MRVCQVEGCGRIHHAKGYCSRHRHRAVRYGDPTAGSEYRSDTLEALSQRFDVEPSGCWRWTGMVDRLGYGRYRIGKSGPTRSAHRVVWEEVVGDLTDDMELDHLCRNRTCVNPDHLEPVDHQTNCQRAVDARKVVA